MNLTRRSALAAGVAVGLAGCLGDGGDQSSDPTAGSEETSLGVPVSGNPDASVTMEVYEDFSCPFCGDFKHGIYPQIETEFLEPGDIRYEHRDFPIPVNEWSRPVANAARAVHDEAGDEALFEFTHEIYHHLGGYSYEVIESVANDLGYDGDAARDAAETEPYDDVITADRERGESLGVGGTPTVVVDESIVEFDEDTPAIESIRNAVEDAKD